MDFERTILSFLSAVVGGSDKDCGIFSFCALLLYCTVLYLRVMRLIYSHNGNLKFDFS